MMLSCPSTITTMQQAAVGPQQERLPPQHLPAAAAGREQPRQVPVAAAVAALQLQTPAV
jgi:hypothetical protein